MREVERYWLDIVRLTSMYSLGSGTLLLKTGWTFFNFSGVARSEWRQAERAYCPTAQLPCVGVYRGK